MLTNKKPSGEALSEPSEDFVNHNISNKRISVNDYTSFINKDYFSEIYAYGNPSVGFIGDIRYNKGIFGNTHATPFARLRDIFLET